MKQASHRRTNIVRFHLYEVPRVGKVIEMENRMGGCQGLGGERIGTEFQFGEMIKFWSWTVVMVVQQHECP